MPVTTRSQKKKASSRQQRKRAPSSSSSSDTSPEAKTKSFPAKKRQSKDVIVKRLQAAAKGYLTVKFVTGKNNKNVMALLKPYRERIRGYMTILFRKFKVNSKFIKKCVEDKDAAGVYLDKEEAFKVILYRTSFLDKIRRKCLQSSKSSTSSVSTASQKSRTRSSSKRRKTSFEIPITTSLSPHPTRFEAYIQARAKAILVHMDNDRKNKYRKNHDRALERLKKKFFEALRRGFRNNLSVKTVQAALADAKVPSGREGKLRAIKLNTTRLTQFRKNALSSSSSSSSSRAESEISINSVQSSAPPAKESKLRSTSTNIYIPYLSETRVKSRGIQLKMYENQTVGDAIESSSNMKKYNLTGWNLWKGTTQVPKSTHVFALADFEANDRVQDLQLMLLPEFTTPDKLKTVRLHREAMRKKVNKAFK